MLTRNDFTHKGIRIYDWSDKDPVFQIFRKMEQLINNGKTFIQCYSRDELIYKNNAHSI